MTGRPIRKGIKSLHSMEYDEVSLVDVPANQYAAVMIAKRHTGDDMTQPLADDLYDLDGTQVFEDELETGDVVQDADGNRYEYTAPEGSPAEEDEAELELELVGKAAGELATRGGSALARAGGRARGRRVSRRALAGAAGAGALAAGGGAALYRRDRVEKSLGDEVREALSKAHTEADRDEVISKALDQIDELGGELDVLATIAKSERDLRLESEYVEVAKSLDLGVNPDVLGPVLKRLAERMDEADVEIIAKTLETVSGALYEEHGYAGSGVEYGASDIADAEAAAEARISKASEPVSKAAGIAAYYDENPAAYDEYMATRR